MKNEKIFNARNMFIAAGAFVSYTIGSAFASGNEILQFFGSWGMPQSFLAVLSGGATTIIFCVCLYILGQSVSFEKTTDTYVFVGGKVLGWFYQIFVLIFVAGIFMLLFVGAGSMFEQFYGLPQWVGSVLLGVITAIIVLGGFKSVENTLGFAGILIIVYIIVFGIVSIFHPAASLDQASGAAQAVAEGKIWQANLFGMPPLSYIPGLAGLNNPVIAGILYGGVCLVTGFPFYLSLGRSMKNKGEATLNGITSSVALYACVCFSLLILLSNFNALINPATDTMFPFPTLAGIEAMWPSGAWTYVIIIFIGIFTTASGYTWVLTDTVFPNEEKTKRVAILIIALLVAGVLLGSVLPMSALINFLFPLAGLAGTMMTISLIVKTIKVTRNKSAEVADK